MVFVPKRDVLALDLVLASQVFFQEKPRFGKELLRFLFVSYLLRQRGLD
jgi:hypothetical protein